MNTPGSSLVPGRPSASRTTCQCARPRLQDGDERSAPTNTPSSSPGRTGQWFELPHRMPSRQELLDPTPNDPALDLHHEPLCSGGRMEEFDVDGPHGSRWRTTRCMDCGASVTVAAVPATRLVPGTEEYARAWRLDRSRIRRQLTTEEELLDPLRNPMHPRAEPDAPVFEGSGRRMARWPSFPGDEGR